MSKKEKAKNYIQSIDIYGVPITLNFKGKSVYQTFLGGMFTVITGLIIAAYFLSGISNVAQRNFDFKRINI
jgi:hypothetical protein